MYLQEWLGVNATVQTRALLYLGTIGNAIMEAMAAVEKSLKAALVQPVAGDRKKTAQPVIDAMRILKEAVAGTKNLLPSLQWVTLAKEFEYDSGNDSKNLVYIMHQLTAANPDQLLRS